MAAERARTAFLGQLVRPRRAAHAAAAAPRAERVALAPDWLFGRGCLSHVRDPRGLLALAAPKEEARTQCALPPTGARQAMPAPGPAGGLLVATHFVYSMALKRKRTFRAFGWDAAGARNRTGGGGGAGGCWRRSPKGMLFGHTFFAQLASTRSVLCAMPAGNGPECACCAPIGSLAALERSRGSWLETTSGHREGTRQRMASKLEGCGDYQLFWDR